MDVDDSTFGNSRGTPPPVMCTILGFNRVLILVWLKVSITQIFNALVELLQAAYHPLVSKHPNDSPTGRPRMVIRKSTKSLPASAKITRRPF